MALNPTDHFLDYRGVAVCNRDVFLVNYPFAVTAFDRIDQGLWPLLRTLSSEEDKNGATHISVLPFLVLFQRQARVVFELLSTHQAYQAWVLLRPCIEVTLLAGKWLQEPKLVKVWLNREEDPKRYQSEFQGRNLRSAALPRSEAIQSVLRRVNDAFLHPNPAYFRRHLDFVPLDDDYLGMQLNYFDGEESIRAHTLAILHLLVLLQDSILVMYKPLFASLSTDSGLSIFEGEFRPRVDQLISVYPDQRAVLEELGLWTL